MVAGVYHRLTTWGNVAGYRQHFSASSGAAPTLEEEVRWSQFLQAEGLRYSWQSHRRAKPHRSAANSWTFNEPWPNAAQGSILGFSGVPKMAFEYMRAAMAMVDISLMYGGLSVKAGLPLNTSITVWIDSELDTPLSDCQVTLEYIDSNGVGTAALLATEQHSLATPVPPGAGRCLSGSRATEPIGELTGFRPPRRMVGSAVLLVRVSLQCQVQPQSPATVHASNTYTFGVVNATDDTSVNTTLGADASSYRMFPGQIPADRTNFTAALQGHSVCESRCNETAACVGFTTDQSATNCWLYDAVCALASSHADAFHLKPGVPVPPHGPPVSPAPPSPPPPHVALLEPLVNAETTHLSVAANVQQMDTLDGQTNITLTLRNAGEHVALFARLALRESATGPVLPYALFSENYGCLLPGEESNATVAIANGGPMVLCVAAWNAAEVCTSILHV